MRKFKVGILYDIHVDTPRGRMGWAFWRRASALQKYAPENFEVDIFPCNDIPWTKMPKYDLLFVLEMTASVRRKTRIECDPFKMPIIVYSFNSGPGRKDHLWHMIRENCEWIIFNNVAGWEHFGKLPATCAISNGIDSEIWRSAVPISERPHRILWTGSSNPKKGKGYQDVLQPLAEMAAKEGFECEFSPVDEVSAETTRTTDEMVQFYNSGSYIVCASESEGTPGSSLEGMACGCVLVTTRTGNAVEFGTDRLNMIFAERNPRAFLDALLWARERRESISAAGQELMHNKWSYGAPGQRASYFFRLFQRLIEDGPPSIRPFSYAGTHWSLI